MQTVAVCFYSQTVTDEVFHTGYSHHVWIMWNEKVNLSRQRETSILLKAKIYLLVRKKLNHQMQPS